MGRIRSVYSRLEPRLYIPPGHCSLWQDCALLLPLLTSPKPVSVSDLASTGLKLMFYESLHSSCPLWPFQLGISSPLSLSVSATYLLWPWILSLALGLSVLSYTLESGVDDFFPNAFSVGPLADTVLPLGFMYCSCLCLRCNHRTLPTRTFFVLFLFGNHTCSAQRLLLAVHLGIIPGLFSYYG